MSFVSLAPFVVIVILAFVAFRTYEAVAVLIARHKARRKDVESPSSPAVKPSFNVKNAPTQAIPELEQDSARPETLQLKNDKDLYFKLQNLERYPEILPQSWRLLVSLLSETLADARKHVDSGILSVEHFTRENLTLFLRTENDKTTQQWEQYVARRKAGSPREMFGDVEEAKWWLKQAAPVKYVDGAWLGHINRITTPFALRRITKNAWQVMSEELGDGDLLKNHVHVYRALMRDIDSGLPEGDTVDFIHPRHKLDVPRVWRAAIAQLLISLFPHDFVPEILGFNMAYEGLPLHLMKTVKELQELKLDAYYFVLHISIDNAASGHAAMAMEAAIEYIEQMQKTQGDVAAHQAWKRVQAGFILAEGLPTTPDSPSLARHVELPSSRTDIEAAVVEVFMRKAAVAHKIHCNSVLKIGRRTLVEWLEPTAFQQTKWQTEFLHDLGSCRPWVIKGDSGKSRLIRELAWEGKMFGSFTQTEVEVVKRWIDSLGNPDFDPHLYWSFTGREEITSKQRLGRKQDVRCDHPVLQDTGRLLDRDTPRASLEGMQPQDLFSQLAAPSMVSSTTILVNRKTDMSTFIPLWFAHPCLLESFVSIPAKVADRTGSAIVRLLRAQSGFETEGPGVAGMDEVLRTDAVGLVELGLEIVRNARLPEPKDLKEALEGRDEGFAIKMLHLAMRPMQNEALLFGLSQAFGELHEAVAASDLLSPTSRTVLQDIARRERESLMICLEELKGDDTRVAEYCRGYNLGKAEIGRCFSSR
ncbi:hypothetical protein LTR66_002417 [Elasticomyces elasticus]|nr:hypothetical protein LTR66_002417 [Elasticomyces elasticus]